MENPSSRIDITPALDTLGKPINSYGRGDNCKNSVPYIDINAEDDYGYCVKINTFIEGDLITVDPFDLEDLEWLKFNGIKNRLNWESAPISTTRTYSTVINFKLTAKDKLQRLWTNTDSVKVLPFLTARDFYIEITPTNTLYIYHENASGLPNIILSTSEMQLDINVEYTMLLSISIGNDAQSTKAHVYINGNDVMSQTSPFYFSFEPIAFAATDLWTYGGSPGGTNLLNGYTRTPWFSTEYIDWSVQANRDKVWTIADGLQDSGSNGSSWSPTSRQPEIFIPRLVSEPLENLGTSIKKYNLIK